MINNLSQFDINVLLEILFNIPEAVVISDKEYRVLYTNKAFQNLIGSSSDTIINKKMSEVLENTSKINCHICNSSPTKYLFEQNYSHQAELDTFTDKKLLIRINHSFIGKREYYISVIIPQSDLICHDQAQMDFVSTVSHELRTPLTSIKGFADTLLSAGDKLDKEQQIRFIGIIKSQADRLTRLVENLLTVSRLETKRYAHFYRAINLRTIVDRVIVSIKAKYPNHNFAIRINPSLPPIWADQDKLEQVLTNLIENAAKYSFSDTNIRIEASLNSINSNQIVIKVIDQGVGIPEEFIPKIFSRFSRIDNPLTRQVQGTGLGLYITKALVESMKGTIQVSSSSNGSAFTVTLNVATDELKAQQGLNDNE